MAPLEGGPPAVHLLGNHELYNFTRKDLQEGIKVPGISQQFRVSAPEGLDANSPSACSSFYSFSPHEGWRVCVLDPYDVSVLSRGGGRPAFELDASQLEPRALALCQANNPNDVTGEDFARGIPPGPDLRWVPFNGAIGERQLAWLQDTLELAGRRNERTILLSHVILLPEATPCASCITLLWNYSEVLEVIRAADPPPVAVLCGHAHQQVFAVDPVSGTHHVTFASPLEVEPGGDASAIIEVFADGMLAVRGRGAVPDAKLCQLRKE
ncbi:unnamed protein product [Polarella glacialis]|uniref:Calcineurin-like phosphoesterase domain-containing protein n=1 Tax=Polarella glacialis TaxID=89957 RepID=A0A813KSP0_POLGL|nr:unnamed protein product [Polarella glacialis]CAE8712001.1 unnamed protein product [Polarella glacialis]